MEYCNDIMNTLKCIGNSFPMSMDIVKTFVDIIVAIIGGICAIKGINLLKTLREKKVAATFSFWSQLCVKLKMLGSRLEDDPSLINNLYSADSQTTWSTAGAPPDSQDLCDFDAICVETFEFIKKAPDQIPAYLGWTDDYTELISFLDDVSHYDIKNCSSRFKFTENYSINERDEYVSSICKVINRMIDNINKAQKDAEKILCKKR